MRTCCLARCFVACCVNNDPLTVQSPYVLCVVSSDGGSATMSTPNINPGMLIYTPYDMGRLAVDFSQPCTGPQQLYSHIVCCLGSV